MAKQFMPELSQKERYVLMQENASKVEQTTYQKTLTPEELAARREDLADNCIRLNKFEDELKEVKDDFKLKMDPLKTINKTLLTEIKTKQTEVTGTLFHMANHDDGMMETYDSDGFLVGSRRLRPEEKQGTIFSLSKAVNQ
ncbi:hypothetical protein PDL71_15265 [Lacibacter sp. MH-610]|uniref:hypothetical protein n=1 Tax=Lacibacter sp. MH-610 TaxID=3020883 RepID=UPI003891F927